MATTFDFGSGRLISIDMASVRGALITLKSAVSDVSNFTSGASVGEIPSGSEVLNKYGQALSDSLKMLQSLSSLLTKDDKSFKSAVDELIEADAEMQRKIGIISSPFSPFENSLGQGR